MPEHQSMYTSGQGTAQSHLSDYTETLLDDQQDHESFWKILGVKIEEILMEVDCMVALGHGKGQTSVAQYRAGMFQQTHIAEHAKAPVVTMAGSFDGSHEGVVLRRPQDEDEYWSISSAAWLHTSNPRRMVLSHVGRINETSEGEEAPDGDCTACSRSGAECMVYRGVFNIQRRDKTGRACSRCRFRGLKCSLSTRKINGNSKRKDGARGTEKREQTRKTSFQRRLRSSGIAQ